MSRVVQAIQGDTVDLICLREFGRTGGVTEQVLDANSHLSQLDAELPAGTRITLPDVPSQAEKQVLQLWD